MFFDDMGDVGRVVGLGLSAYLVLVALLRVSGKRTLAKLNAFDLVVTVAFGSVLATSFLSATVSLAESAAAFATLALAQFAVAKLSVVRPAAGRLVRARPTALLVAGRMRPDALRAERVTAADVHAAVRSAGIARTEDVAAVVLETDGSISVLADAPAGATALDGVAGWPEDHRGGDEAEAAAVRTTEDVLRDHLHCRRNGDIEGDLARNYDRDVVLLSAEGVNRGHDGVRLLARILQTYVPAGAYDYRQLLCEGEIGMLQWTAHGGDVEIHDGADSYVVRDGRIVAQTIHYSVR